jgi:hypothetical protein
LVDRPQLQRDDQFFSIGSERWTGDERSILSALQRSIFIFNCNILDRLLDPAIALLRGLARKGSSRFLAAPGISGYGNAHA